MSPSPRSGRIGLLVAIGLLALAIAVGAIVLAVNPPFQSGKPTPTSSSTTSASLSPSATASATATPTTSPTATPTASPSPTPTPTATPRATAQPTPTGDPVPDDADFRAAVSPLLNDAATGLDIITVSIAAGSFTDAQDVTTQLSNDVQRLLDNPKPSDPETWNSAVQAYADAVTSLDSALVSGDASSATSALETAGAHVTTLVDLVG